MAVSFTITRTTTRFHDSNGNGVQDPGELDFDNGEIGVYDPGDILYTRINITNTGSDPATGVTIQDVTTGTTPVANPNDPADLSFINISPIASNDTFTAVGNTVLRVGTANTINGGESTYFAGNLTSNDVGSLTGDDVAGFQIDTVTNGVTAKGGTFNIFSDGTFNYLNDSADTDAELSAGDTFTYKIRDAGMDGTYGTADDLTSTATVTINFSTQSGAPGTAVNRVWYVDGSKNTDGNGTSANPFQSSQIASKLSGAGGAGDVDADGHIIYVENTASGSIQLEASQKLIGTGEELNVGGFAIAADSGGNSALNATSGFAVTLSTGNTIAGINLGGTGGISGTSFGTLTVTDDVVLNTTGTALSLTTGAVAGTGFASTTSTGGLQNVLLSAVTGTVNLGSGALSGATGVAPTEGNLVVNGGSANVNYSGTIGQGAVDVAALNVRGAHSGTINLTGNITATDGLGLQFTDADGTYNLTGVISLTGTGEAGIDIVGGSNGAFTFGTASNLATVTNNSGGDAFVVTNSNANVTFNGTITDNNGNAVNIDGHDGGTITFQNGSINSTGSGIDVANSNGGAINFNSQVTLSTGASTGIILINNNGSTTNFNPTGSGLDITTSSGTGFIATNGGTITIADSGAGNSINVTAGAGGAVGFSATGGTTFGAGGVTFDSISQSGGTNGIVLNGTGSVGGFTVMGDGTAANNGSGGTIQNTTGSGIAIDGARNVVLNQMNVTNSGVDGINVNNINGLTLNRLTITDNSSTSLNNAHQGIEIGNFSTGTAVNGAINITNTSVTYSSHNNLSVGIGSGTSTWNISNSTFSFSGGNGSNDGSADVAGNSGVAFELRGSAVVNSMTISNNTFEGNYATGLQISNSADATGSLKTNITNNTFKNNNIGMDLNALGAATMTYVVTGNSVVNDTRRATSGIDGTSHAVNVFQGTPSTGTLNLYFANNTIGDNAIAGSGSSFGNGLRVNFNSNGLGVVQIHNNFIYETPVGRGIEVIGRNGSGRLDVTITNNTVDHINLPFNTNGGSDFPLAAILVQSNNTGGGAYTVRSDVRGNTVPGGVSSDIGAGYIHLDLAGASVHQLVDNPPGPAGQTAQQQLASTNTGSTSADSTVVLIAGPISTPPQSMMVEAAPAETQPEDEAVGNPPAGDTAGSQDNPPQGQPLPATDGATAGPVVVDDGVLSQAELDLIVDAAIQRWAAAGASEEQIAAMRAVKVSVADLGGLTLGESNVGTIVLDNDAAGWNWFIDSTPGDDSEYAGSGSRLLAADKLGAAGTRIDLLTVLTHELGHQIGLSDLSGPGSGDELMFGTIGAGERRLPGSDDLSHAGDSPVAGAFAFAPITLGTIPAGQTVIVEYRQTINAPAEDGLVGSWSGQSIVDSTETVEELSNAESGTVDGLALGDRIFNDNNKNGLYDAGDSTFAGVVLTLYADTNNNGSYDEGVELYVGYNEVNNTPGYQQGVDTPAAAGTGTPLKATTNATGHYSFSSLAPGDYIVRVDASNFQAGGALFGKVSTPGVKNPNDTNADGDSNVAAPADVNVDNDDNGEQFLIGQAGTYAASRAIRLDYGQETVAGPTGPALDTNNSLDLAFFTPNAAPVIGAVTGDAQTYYENGAPIAIDLGGNATVTDEGANFDGGSLTVSWNGSTGDRLTFGPGTSFDANNDVFVGATKIGTLSTSANQIVVNFNASATPANVQTLIRAFQFDVNGNTPTAGVRTFTFTLVDGDGNDGGLGNDTGTATATITVVPVSDAPEGADRTGTGLYDSTGAAYAFTVADFATGFTDPNDSPANSFSGVKITTLPAASAGTIYFDSNPSDATPGVAIAAGDTFTAQDLTDGKLTFVGAPGSGGMAMSFTFQVIDNGSTDNGGVVMDGSPNTFSTTIVAGNSAPVIDLDGDDSAASGTGFASTYVEGGAAAIGDSDVKITDANSGDDVVRATITITNAVAGDRLVVGTLPSTVTVDPSSTDTVLKLVAASGTSAADFEAAIEGVRFDNTGNDPTVGGTKTSRTVTVTVNDGTSESAAATATISVIGTNDSPDGTNATITAVEDSFRVLTVGDFGFTDPDSADSMSAVTITAVNGAGQLYYDADGTAGSGAPVAVTSFPQTYTVGELAAGNVSYRAPADSNGNALATIGFQVVDSGSAGNSTDPVANLLTVNVTAQNDTPVLTTPSPVAATEQTAVQLLPAGSVSDSDLDALNGGNGNYAGAQFSVNRNSAASTDDVFTLVAGPNFTIDGINLKTTGGQIFATISANNPGLIVINFTSSEAIATSALVDEVIQAVRYTNVSDNPPASVDLAVGFTDGSPNAVQGGGASGLDVNVVTVNIAATNDAPVLDLNGAAAGSNATLAFSEGNGVTRIAPDATVSDVDSADFAGGTLVVDLTKVGAGDHLGILEGNGITVDVGAQKVFFNSVEVATYAITNLSGTYTFTFNSAATAAAVQAVVRQVSFANQNDAQVSGDRTVSYTLTDGDGGTANVVTATVSVTAVDDAPVAQPDTVSTPENAVGTGSLLSDNGSGADSDAEGDPITISAVSFGSVGVPFEFASGVIVTVNSDGTYSINPNGKYNKLTDGTSGAVNTSASETFTYTVTGGNTVTVTVRVTGVAGPGDELHGNAGDNTINGTAGRDIFILDQGGNDTANGYGSSDLFVFGAALTSQDKVDGGDGRDQIAIQGDYTGGNALTLGTGVINVESFAILPGTAVNYSYHVTTVNENVAAGVVTTFDGAQLRAGENFTFRGAAETDGSFRVIGGLGIDNFVGGSQSDVFLFNDGAFGNSDVVNGGAGSARDQLALRGDYSFLIFGSGQLISIESLVLLSGHDVAQNTDYDYTIGMHDNNLIGGSMTVDAAQLRADENFIFFGQNETDGFFRISGGAGDDQILGGQLGDRIRGNGGNDNIFGNHGGDELWGGAGNDRFAYDLTTHSNAASTDKIMDFTTGDVISLEGIDAKSGTAGDDAFTFIGSAAFTVGTAGQLRAYEDSSQAGHWFVEADVNGDGQADLVIEVYTTDLQPLDASDFTL